MYQKYNDDELIVAYNDMMDYSGEISADMQDAISMRGGIDNFLKLVQAKKQLHDEIFRVKRAVYSLTTPDMEIDLLKKLITSDILPAEDLDKIITQTFNDHKATLKNNQITKDTIVLSLIGLLIAAVLGGLLWYLSIALTKEVAFIVIIPVYVFDYFIIYMFTGKSRSNAVVFVASVLATIGSLLLGWCAFGLKDILI